MPKKTINAFTLLELLVVIAILGVFSVIAYPNVTKWITDREVKKEVYDFVAEINEMKSKVSNGEYALAMVFFDTSKYSTTFDFGRPDIQEIIALSLKTISTSLACL